MGYIAWRIKARRAELDAGFTLEKAKVEAMKARLSARLHEHFQRRDRLRLVIGYRRKERCERRRSLRRADGFDGAALERVADEIGA